MVFVVVAIFFAILEYIYKSVTWLPIVALCDKTTTLTCAFLFNGRNVRKSGYVSWCCQTSKLDKRENCLINNVYYANKSMNFYHILLIFIWHLSIHNLMTWWTITHTQWGLDIKQSMVNWYCVPNEDENKPPYIVRKWGREKALIHFKILRMFPSFTILINIFGFLFSSIQFAME